MTSRRPYLSPGITYTEGHPISVLLKWRASARLRTWPRSERKTHRALDSFTSCFVTTFSPAILHAQYRGVKSLLVSNAHVNQGFSVERPHFVFQTLQPLDDLGAANGKHPFAE